MGKRRRATGKVRISERDERILEDAGRLGAVTLSLMHEKYWQGRKERTCEDRLEQLVKAKLLQTEIMEIHKKPVKVYFLDKKGKNIFDKETRQHFYRNRPNEIEIAHVLHVVDYLHTRQDRVVHFVNERELRSTNLKLSEEERDVETTDGYVEEATDDGGLDGYFLEIDSGAAGSALSSKCTGLNAKAQKSGKLVRYIVYSNARYKAVTTAFKDVGGASNVQIILSK